MYRLNYGNGTVSEMFERESGARAAYKRQRQYDKDNRQLYCSLYIERYVGDGEWIRVQSPILD